MSMKSVGVNSSRAQGKERVLGGQVLDSAALLTQGQLSEQDVCRAHIKQLTQLGAAGANVCNLVDH